MSDPPTRRPLRVVIAEDEPVARDHLRGLVEETPDLELVGEAADGEAALALLAASAPDVAFLDIRMPVRDGLEVAAAAPRLVHVVFTTAYDAHAVAAFELGAVDYLLKPFGAARFAAAVARVREVVEARRVVGHAPAASARDGAMAHDATPAGDDVPDVAARVRELREGAGEPAVPIERVFVRERGRLVPVLLRDVEHLEAEDDYVALVVGGRRHLLGTTLTALVPRLDPARFVRIHRSHVVNLDHVASIAPYDAGRYVVQLRRGTQVVASRRGTQLLRTLTGG